MSGIAGWIDHLQDISEEHFLLKAMNQSLAQRGPDDEGVWLSKHAALTHRRLRIDHDEGVQPFVWQCGSHRLVITYNGRLYNTDELRHRLQGRGYPLKTTVDAELILSAYAEWGTACPSYLNGMFSFALWDEQEQQLYLARDRFGMKPLFYAQRGSTFLFGSELKALLVHPKVEPVLDGNGLAEILALGPARTPGEGVFRDVKELLPGHWLLVTAQGIKGGAYWRLNSQSHTDGKKETIAKVEELLYQAVKGQMIGEEPVGTMLSGGLDSSGITSIVAKQFQKQEKGNLQSFSVDYEENERYFKSTYLQPNTDAPWVRRVSEDLNTKHHWVTLQVSALVEALTPALRARDLPGMVDIDSSLYLFCKNIREEGINAVLSGEGADEVFGGYPWFHRPEMIHANTFPWSRMVAERMRFFSPEIIDYMEPEVYVNRRYQEALSEVPLLSGEEGIDKRLRELFYLNLTRWMPTLLDRSDRMSAAAGVEVRLPFCDHHLVEYVWNIPWSMKYLDGQEKGLLRKALTKWLPKDVLTRRKSPYPKTHHPTYLALVREQAMEVINDRDSPLYPLLNYEALRRFISQDLSKIDLPWFSQLLNVPQLLAYFVQLDRWLREYRVRIY